MALLREAPLPLEENLNPVVNIQLPQDVDGSEKRTYISILLSVIECLQVGTLLGRWTFSCNSRFKIIRLYEILLTCDSRKLTFPFVFRLLFMYNDGVSVFT